MHIQKQKFFKKKTKKKKNFIYNNRNKKLLTLFLTEIAKAKHLNVIRGN